MDIGEYILLLSSHLFAVPSLYWCYHNKFVFEGTTLLMMLLFAVMHYACDMSHNMCVMEYENYLMVDYLLSNQMIMTYFVYLLNISPIEYKFLPNYISGTVLSASLLTHNELDKLPIASSIGIVSLGSFMIACKLILLFMKNGMKGLYDYFKIFHLFDVSCALMCFGANTGCYWMFIQTGSYVYYSMWHVFIYMGTWCLLTSFDSKKQFLCCSRKKGDTIQLLNRNNANSSHSFTIS